MSFVVVSPEMTTIFENDATAPVPHTPVAFTFAADTVRIEQDPGNWPSDGEFRFLVARDALARLFSWKVGRFDGAHFHLSHGLRRIAADLCAAERSGEVLTTYRLAKSIELLCDLVGALLADTLVPAADAPLTVADTERVMLARRMVDERCGERLTLDGLARACGLNRAKLTRGFRALYRCSVAEALAERRLSEAGVKLRATNLPISTIGYQSGYLNNASFARAFGRRFGQSPSGYRAMRIAA